MNNENLLKPLTHSYVYFPFLGATFVFGLTLLFYRDLDCALRTILVPAVAIYILGTSLVGYVYNELDVINCVKARAKAEAEAKEACPMPQPFWVTIIIWLVHAIWFSLLVIYLFWKSAL